MWMPQTDHYLEATRCPIGQYERQYQWQQIYQQPTSYGNLQFGTDVIYSRTPAVGEQQWDSRLFFNWSRQF